MTAREIAATYQAGMMTPAEMVRIARARIDAARAEDAAAASEANTRAIARLTENIAMLCRPRPKRMTPADGMLAVLQSWKAAR